MEYDVMLASSLPNASNLNEQAAKGWQLLQIVLHEGKIFCYFQRPLAR